MTITQDVRDYTDALSDNEKVNLEEQAKEGMAGMSEKFKEMGGKFISQSPNSLLYL